MEPFPVDPMVSQPPPAPLLCHCRRRYSNAENMHPPQQQTQRDLDSGHSGNGNGNVKDNGSGKEEEEEEEEEKEEDAQEKRGRLAVAAAFQKGKDTSCPLPLVDFHSAPEYLRDNEYILRYYRAHYPIRHALRSLFSIHNETLNVWTHLGGFLLFLCLTVMAVKELPTAELLSSVSRCLRGVPKESNSSEHCLMITAAQAKADLARMVAPMLKPTDRWPFFVFLGGSMFCLLASSACHLLSCHSKPMAVFLMRIDYTGIAAMIVSSFFPPIYYIFQCSPLWQVVYLGTISVMGVASVIVLFAPSLQSGKYRPFRAMLFMSMGLSGIIPAVHAVIKNWHEPMCVVTVLHEAGMALFYATGTLIYVVRVPERWKPGLFDLAGHSHNLFHVLVVAGAYTHYRAALLFLEWRDQTGCD